MIQQSQEQVDPPFFGTWERMAPLSSAKTERAASVAVLSDISGAPDHTDLTLRAQPGY